MEKTITLCYDFRNEVQNMSKRKWLCDKTIVISGASSGIGRGLSKYLIEKYNCNIIGIGRNEDKMKSLLAELGDKCEKSIKWSKNDR